MINKKTPGVKKARPSQKHQKSIYIFDSKKLIGGGQGLYNWKVAKWQANYAQTVAHLMWKTEPSESYL